jgi:hypothetical protein
VLIHHFEGANKNFVLTMLLSEHIGYIYKLSETSQSTQASILGEFLTSSVKKNARGISEAIQNDLDKSFGMNSTLIDKDSEYVILRDLYSEEPDRGPEVHIPKFEMLRLLDWWEKVWKNKPVEIKLIFDGERFTFQPDYGI